MLGLDATAERVYRTMLSQPQAGLAALATALDLTQEQVGNALDTLSELSLVRPSHERHGLRAVSPDVGMELLLARQSVELAAQQQRLEASRATAAQLISEYADLRPKDSSPGVEQLVGIDQVRDRLARLSREVNTEVMTLAPGGAHTEADLQAARQANEGVLERGITMRTVYLDSLRNNAPTLAYVNWLAERGGSVRTVPTLPTRMVIVDRSLAVIPVSSDDAAAGAVVLTGHGTVTALVALFEGIWASAQPLGAAPTVDPHGLTPQERGALLLLADGHTDDAIAKRLGISPRSARRIATELIERLGARSRFQAGARAAQHGWLTP